MRLLWSAVYLIAPQKILKAGARCAPYKFFSNGLYWWTGRDNEMSWY